MTFRQVLIFILGITLPHVALAKCNTPLRIINASDQHSAYDNIPAFINRIYELRQKHLHACPQGKVILLINGDFSGLSKWAVDRGDLNYTVLAQLAHHFEIVVNVGNHEGFDWEGELGNRLFHSQNIRLVRQISLIQKRPFRLINSNLETTAIGRDFIEPYRDIRFGDDQKIRFVGLALENFFEKTDYGKKESPQLFTTQVTSLVEAGERALAEAARDRIDILSFAAHDGLINVKQAMEKIVEIRDAKYPQVTLGPSFAAHDHRPGWETAKGVPIFDGGERYSFVVTDVTAAGQSAGHEFFSAERDNGRCFSKEVCAILEQVRNTVKETAPLHQQVLALLPNTISTDRKDLQSMRTPLGNAIAESLVDWGKSIVARFELRIPVVAFFNSSSYRLETEIPAGPLRAGTLWDIYPHNSSARIGLVKGKDLKILFASIRKHRAQEADPRRRYTPQMSTNLIEHSLMDLQYKNGHGPELMPDDKVYALVLDGWLAKNGYGLPEWNDVFSRIKWVNDGTIKQQELFRSYLPEHLRKLSTEPCRYEIAAEATAS